MNVHSHLLALDGAYVLDACNGELARDLPTRQLVRDGVRCRSAASASSPPDPVELDDHVATIRTREASTRRKCASHASRPNHSAGDLRRRPTLAT
jgi:hypothetical protein